LTILRSFRRSQTAALFADFNLIFINCSLVHLRARIGAIRNKRTHALCKCGSSNRRASLYVIIRHGFFQECCLNNFVMLRFAFS
jgi:hypothetical protein